MKLIISVLLLCSGSYSVIAGPIRDMAINNPEQVNQLIQGATYAELLTFVNDAYAESQGETDGVCEYAYLLALSHAPPDQQVPLAVDFSLAKPHLDLKRGGAASISSAVVNGTSITQTVKNQAIAKLKSELQLLQQHGQEAFNFAQNAANALVLLGDDAGLDMFLTDSQIVRNYQLKDQWDATTPAGHFADLRDEYAQRAADPATGNPEWEKTISDVYELCRARRAENIEVKPLNPLVNLVQVRQQ